MGFEIEPISKVKQRITVHVTDADIQTVENKMIAEVRKDIKVPGFRVGKVPAAIIRKHLGANLRRDAIEQACRVALSDALMTREDLIELVNVEYPENDEGKGVKFCAEFEIDPPLELLDYTGIEVERMSDVVTDQEVEDRIEAMREQHATFLPIEDRDEAQEGDVAFLTLACDDEGAKKIGLVGKRDTRIGSGELVNAKFENAMIGQKVGEVRMIVAELHDGCDCDSEDCNLRETMLVSCTLDELKTRILPELDDEFAKDTSVAETLDEMKVKIREDLEKHKKRMADLDVDRKILDKLRELHQLEIPMHYIRARTASMMQSQYKRLFHQNISEETVRRLAETLSEDDLRRAIDEYCDGKLLVAISDKENITIEEKDLLQKVGEWLGENCDEGRRLEWLDEDSNRESLSDTMRCEKALELLRNAAVITQK